MRDISGHTQVVALLGYPVEHSLSPAMHNAAFEAAGLDMCYVALPVHPSEVQDAVRGLRAMNFAGANVTVPHKQAVMPFLDEVHPEAAFIGAVNTIVNRSGKLIGHNTDGAGFMRSLDEAGISVDGRRVFVVGAGGASRAVSWYLAERAAHVNIHNRTRDKAERIVEDLSINFKNCHVSDGLEAIGEADVVINTTSVGLRDGDSLPFDEALLKGQDVVDLVYNRRTKLIESAGKAGCRTVGGLGMLLWQGALAFELWTGVGAPEKVMYDKLLQAFG